jgi:hypothetical protein
MNDWFEKHKTIPVSPESLFPEAAELLSERGMDWDDINTIYKDRNLKLGGVDYVPEQDHLGTKGVHSYRGSEPAFLSITEEGETAYDESKAAPRIHEYFHYLDKVMDMGGSGIAQRMAGYGDNLSSEEMLESWMNDPKTEHLDLDNPENKGLRTLLKNRLHHEGVVNVREDIGRFLSTMLNDEQYSKWLNKDFVVKNKGYYSNPSEMLSYAAQPMVKETDRDKAYKKVKWYFGTDWKIDDLDKGLADSIATYANARYLENKGWM